MAQLDNTNLLIAAIGDHVIMKVDMVNQTEDVYVGQLNSPGDSRTAIGPRKKVVLHMPGGVAVKSSEIFYIGLSSHGMMLVVNTTGDTVSLLKNLERYIYRLAYDSATNFLYMSTNDGFEYIYTRTGNNYTMISGKDFEGASWNPWWSEVSFVKMETYVWILTVRGING